MIARKYILVLCLIIGFLPLTLCGQQEETVGREGSTLFSTLIIKFSPLALLEVPQPSLQLAVEYPVANSTLSLQHELGWLPPMTSLGLFENGTKHHGLKIKTELRYYLHEQELPDSKPHHSTYFAVEGMYRMRMLRNEGWHRINNGSFSQWLITDQYRQQAAFHFKYGRMSMLSTSNKILIDSYVGLGLRRYFANTPPNTKDLQGEPQSSNSSYDFVLPSITLGFKIGIGVK